MHGCLHTGRKGEGRTPKGEPSLPSEPEQAAQHQSSGEKVSIARREFVTKQRQPLRANRGAVWCRLPGGMLPPGRLPGGLGRTGFATAARAEARASQHERAANYLGSSAYLGSRADPRYNYQGRELPSPVASLLSNPPALPRLSSLGRYGS